MVGTSLSLVGFRLFFFLIFISMVITKIYDMCRLQVGLVKSDSISRAQSSGFLTVSSMVEPEIESKPKLEKETTLEPESGGHRQLKCTTFNILAPIYKRIDPQNPSLRESDFRALWLTRNQRILDWLLHERSSIICLQEFWIGNEELVRMYLEGLGDAGYITFKLARTNNRGDGLLTAVRKDYFRVLHYRELLFNDFGDRVAQLLHVQLDIPSLQNQKSNLEREILIVNTHLLFPHNSSLSIVRLHQVYTILQYVESYQRENQLKPMSIILCGDWNGSKRGHVYKFLRSQGFESTYDAAHQYRDNNSDPHKWVSHRNHRGNICGVDFVWLRNPIKSHKPLKTSWVEAVFSILRYQLRKASMTETDAFSFLKGDNLGDFVTYSAFCDALRQVSLVGVPCGLTFQETRDLWIQADIDGNGVVDYEEFKRIWYCTCSEEEEEEEEEEVEVVDDKSSSDDTNKVGRDEALGFKAKSAVMFPREVEIGMWPENYTLSDHACLTVVLSPLRLKSSTHSRYEPCAFNNCSL